MAMSVLNLTAAQKDAGQQIYSGFYGYAIGQGADPATATQFANIGLGVSSGEGLGKSNPWSANADGQVTSVGPFQLNITNGVGADAGLGSNATPQQQISAAAATMWGEPGTGGSYNTQPWNAVGDTTGPGSGVGNDTVAGQSAAENIGAQIAAKNGFTTSGGALPNPTQTTTAYDGALQGDTNGVGPFDVNGPVPAAAGGGAAVDASNPGAISGSPSDLPVMTATPPAVASNLNGAAGAGVTGANGSLSSVTASGTGLPVNITDITGAGSQTGKALDSTITQTEQAAAGTGTGWLSSFELSGTNWLVRGGLFLLACVLLLGAWQFYSVDNRSGAPA